MQEFTDANRANWDERAGLHAARNGSGYDVGRYIQDPALLSEVVRFDVPRLGDISGKRAVHLQCHIGTDTISLARLGARVTGLDFSPVAVAEARSLAEDAGDDVDFVESDVYAAPQVLEPGTFDLVYTGVGALCWLPSVSRWARVVAELLAPGGRLFIRESHPIVWAVDERIEGDIHLRFPYFETAEPLPWDEEESYVEVDRPLTATRTYSWNHGLGEIVTAVMDAGLTLTGLTEHDSLPWQAYPGQMVERPGGEWALDKLTGVMPLSYTLQAVKPG